MKSGELYKLFAEENKATDELGDVMYTTSVWAGKITGISRDPYSMSIDYSKGICLEFSSENRLGTGNIAENEIKYWQTKSDEIREINGTLSTWILIVILKVIPISAHGYRIINYFI